MFSSPLLHKIGAGQMSLFVQVDPRNKAYESARGDVRISGSRCPFRGAPD